MERTPLHILWLSGWYPNRHHRTLGNFVQRHAEAVSSIHNVDVIAPIPSALLKWKYECVVDSPNENLREHRLYYPKRLSGLGAAGALFFLLRKWKKEKKSVDIIHAHVLLSVFWMLPLCRLFYKAPTTLTEHWAGYHHGGYYKLPLWKKKWMANTGKKIDLALPVTRHLGETLKDLKLVKHYDVVENVVDTVLFHPEKPKEINEKRRFLHISTLYDPQKNISGLLRVIAKVQNSEPNVHFTILGDGDPEAYQAYAKELGIREDVLLIEGEKSLTEIASIMQNHDVFVLFSNYENFPCVIAEAWACGLPVISTDVGGIAEHLHKKNGMLIQEKDENALQHAFVHFCKNYDKYDPDQIAHYAKAHFSREAIALKFDRAYQNILKLTNQ